MHLLESDQVTGALTYVFLFPIMNSTPRIQRLQAALDQKILLIDGAMGTAIQNANLTEADFGGATYEGCNENVSIVRPDIISKIHQDYRNAGADILSTNTFGGVPFVLDEFSLGPQAHEINRRSAELARAVAGETAWVAGSMGPTTKAVSVTGGITFSDLISAYLVQARGLAQGGVDYFLLETCQDMRNVKAGLHAIDQLEADTGQNIPVAISLTIEPMGTMLAGQTVEAAFASLAHRNLLYIGLNCATGPEFMTDHLRSLSEIVPWPVACVPNAGLPDEDGLYLENPEMVATVISRFIENGWINILGGCCGTTPEHIAALDRIRKTATPPKRDPRPQGSFLSGIDYLQMTDEMRPILVAERTNVIGSRKFKRLITDDQLDEASEIARTQIKNGAQIVDICLANPDRDEMEDMRNFLEVAAKNIRAPLMIDSTDAAVIDLALTYSQGKAIINSINLEDGEERFEQVVPIGKKHGAAFVVGTIDEDQVQGMGVSRARKLEIAERSYNLLTKKYGVPPEDICFDPLVFPCGTGDEQYVGSALETVEGIRLIKEKLPLTKTILGISNVSFGLPPAGREVLNSVFLYHCVQAGLDLAIVNSEKLERYASISDVDRKICEDLLWNRTKDPVADFAAHFRDKKTTNKKPMSNLTLDERLAQYIIEGIRDGLVPDLEEKLKDTAPLDIINGPLMKGMDEVGRLFNANQLIVAEVLQSAESMKAAVAHLEPLMDKDASASRGKVLLATVKGDVHDIGKNLVEIILGNNGFEVINLGIKVPPEVLISAIREHNPDIVGLSGLLVKSAQQMVLTAQDCSEAGTTPKMLVGGAALSERFVDKKISPVYRGTVSYAQDAMSGLDLAKIMVEPERFEVFEKELHERRLRVQDAPKKERVVAAAPKKRSSTIEFADEIPQPADFNRHIVRNIPIEQVWNFINPLMLYYRHLGIPGGVAKKLDLTKKDPRIRKEIQEKHPRALEIWETVETVKSRYRDFLKPTAVYQFFPAESSGNTLSVIRNNGTTTRTDFEFGRQNRPEGLCLADYVQPSGGPKDNVALFATTAGDGVRAEADRLKEQGDYLQSHILQVLALESAEGLAEWLHAKIRMTWGFPDPPEMSMMNRFQAKYRGKRFSFGYPACPRLEDQAPLFQLLRPEEIGIQLTDGMMMDPEASVSAIVFHHPQASYFSIGGDLTTDEGRFDSAIRTT